MNELLKILRIRLGCAAVIVLVLMPNAIAQETSENLADFENHIRPVLAAKCLSCHGPDKQEGGLRLDSLSAILAGGDSGPALESGDPAASVLMEAINYEGFEMPPTGQLSPATIGHFQRWIAAGAAWPDSEEIRVETGLITDQDRQWWAFQPLDRSLPPEVDNPAWNANPIDQFVFSALHKKGIEPAPEADAATLVRRLYLDVVGMPPTATELHAFLDAPDPGAEWPALVDRLLDDPRYGEHWARHWLDLVRYSESDGWNQDAYRPHIWRYRDYVVDAFNSDKPYPAFVREQLAGDEMPGDDPEPRIAAGLLRLGIYEYNQRDSRRMWDDIMNEVTDVTGDVFLGLSMQCCRCHDHKFDPLPQKDYFRLRAFFEPMRWRDDLVGATEAEKRQHTADSQLWLEKTADIRARLAAFEEPFNATKWASTVDKFPVDIQACFQMPVADRTSWQDQMAYLVSRQFAEEANGPFGSLSKTDKAKHKELLEELASFDELKPADLPKLMTATDSQGFPAPTWIPEDASRSPIAPDFLRVMARAEFGKDAFESEDVRPKTTGRRTALAAWIGDAKNPLTTRVIVNRVWQQHFGRGLVSTSNDFGTQGERPTHPLLLDWLTANYVDNGWLMKDLHRMILCSKAWRQSAHHANAAENQRIDPLGNLIWRWNIRRMHAEQIRDAMLSASGELKVELGGPSVTEEVPRRALYLKSFRNANNSFLHGFDLAGGLKSVSIRDSTTTPTQALLLINGTYALARATAMASQLETEYSGDSAAILDAAFERCWGRMPTAEERLQASEFLGIVAGEAQGPVDLESLVDFCHVLFNSNPFLYVE